MGLAAMLPSSSTRKARIHGINLSSWEDSDEEGSDADDGILPVEDDEESDAELDELEAEDVDSDVDVVSDCDDVALD